jgi:hypothetical protein
MRTAPQPAWVFVEPRVVVDLVDPPPPEDQDPEELGVLLALMGR